MGRKTLFLPYSFFFFGHIFLLHLYCHTALPLLFATSFLTRGDIRLTGFGAWYSLLLASSGSGYCQEATLPENFSQFLLPIVVPLAVPIGHKTPRSAKGSPREKAPEGEWHRGIGEIRKTTCGKRKAFPVATGENTHWSSDDITAGALSPE
ncbi:uncharacterized protein LOC129747181 [Uranotaenia lowii]|uniref:uncharacterized protein LOC129747181 n=1 Tax=Uranotaenia lowii TaxID=190385 RepID=UPI0024784E70|nr:uncharacterized protein LOC129747181 [Uranotaenia lowii]